MECESISDTSNNWDNWNHLKIFQTIPQQCIGKAQNRGTTKNSHIGHCTYTLKSTNVKEQNIFHVQNNTTCSTNHKYRTAVTLCTLETWFVSGIKL